jgi:hypothetical protein
MRKRRGGEAFIYPCVLLILLVLSCSSKPTAIVKSYVEAYNARDLERLLSLHSENVTFEVVGQVSIQGKEKVRDLAEYDFALNITMSLGECRTRGDSVMCELAETNDWLKATGIEEAHYSVTFVVGDGLIESIRAQQVPETAQAFKEVLGPLLEWASEHRPQQVAEMMPEGEFIYNAENARKSLLLLREWKGGLQGKDNSPIWKKIGE